MTEHGARKLMRLNRRITKLSSELETLQFMQDRLERELESEKAPRPRGRARGGGAEGRP